MAANDVEINPELLHYGILGMKWGVRRASNASAKVASLKKASAKKGLSSPADTAKLKKAQAKAQKLNLKVHKMKTGLNKGEHESKESKEARGIKVRSVKSMSNSDLKKLNQRMKLEKEYSTLNGKNTSIGKKFANRFSDQLVTGLTQSLVNQSLNTAGSGVSALANAAKKRIDR